MHVISWHDNSAANKNNPDPRNWVGFGNRTTDDMARHWLTFYYMSDDEFKAEHAERNALKKVNATQSAAELAARGWWACRRVALVARVLCWPRRAVAAAQIRYATGQNVVPVFEGWERNADGTFNMVFGYMNRNYEEELDIAGRPGQQHRVMGRPGLRAGAGSGPADALLPAPPAVRVHGPGAEGLGQEGSRLDADRPRQDREGLRRRCCRSGSSAPSSIRRIAAASARSAPSLKKIAAPTITLASPAPVTIGVGQSLTLVASVHRRWTSDAAEARPPRAGCRSVAIPTAR